MSNVKLEGLKIKKAGVVNASEIFGDEFEKETCVIIELENGVVLYPSMDYEGNGPGVLSGFSPFIKGNHFSL